MKFTLYVHVQETGDRIKMDALTSSPIEILQRLFEEPIKEETFSIICEKDKYLMSITIRNSESHRKYIAGILSHLVATTNFHL